MRRAAPSLPISPRLLKHFAAATLAITTCIAIFADGSTTEAVAETVKQNELKKTEVDMLGSRTLAFKGMKVKSGGMTMDDPAPEEGGGGGSYYEGPIIPPSYGGGTGGQPSKRPEDFLPGGELAKKAREAARPRKLTPEELAKLQEASRLRTGASAVN
ncbi:MAG: hypothetical protein RL339_1789 [Pseudomonadota bacterium]|jgi:hypothetical protein